MKQTYAGVLNSIDFSFSCLIMNMASVVDLFRLKPYLCFKSFLQNAGKEFHACVQQRYAPVVVWVRLLSFLEYRDTFVPFRRYFRSF